jgi:hypothetical protein
MPMRKEAENKPTRQYQGKGCLVLLIKDSYAQYRNPLKIILTKFEE